MIRVVFVDDDVSALTAMQRSLHCMRNEWSMAFVSSGAAALEELARIPAAVIVSDMRMPGMDGWQLLGEVKARHPETVRLILSGHAEPSSIMRSVGVAHHYLAKPCDSASLKAATAIAARTVALCEETPAIFVEEAFLASMLHDIGKVVFATRPATVTKCTEASAEVATAQMLAHQAEVGAYLLGLWGFPTSIVGAVALHHSPSNPASDGLDLPRLIHIADRLVHQRVAEYSGPFERRLEPELLETLGLVERWAVWLAALDSVDFVRTAA